MINYKKIRTDFNSLKELVEGEILRYDLFPPKDDLEKIHLEACKEALEKVNKYFSDDNDSSNRILFLEKARKTINSHFLKNHETHEAIMADKTTGYAMIGYMLCMSDLNK